MEQFTVGHDLFRFGTSWRTLHLGWCVPHHHSALLGCRPAPLHFFNSHLAATFRQ
jgi:hypothetical protein